VLLLDELEEGGHVRPAEVVDGLQTGEHAAAVQALEVVLANVLKTKETWHNNVSTIDSYPDRT
jgi:hypothetical protein